MRSRTSVARALIVLVVVVGASSASAQDCNNNGIPDLTDITSGTSMDVNANGVPDECERCNTVESFKLTARDAAASDRFAFGAAVHGDMAVFGAPMEDTVSVDAGAAYVFQYSGGVWSESARLFARDGDTFDHFGTAVALGHNVAVVGAPDDDDGGSGSGAAYVYRFNGGAWTQEAKLIAADDVAGDAFGSAVAIVGDVVVVGAPRKDAAGTDSGAAYVFRFVDGAWTQEARLVPADGAAGDDFGRALAAGDDVVLIGAPLDDNPTSNAGSAYIYRFASGNWVAEAKLAAAAAGTADQFGRAVAVEGDRAVIGAPEDDDRGSNAGSVYVFGRGGGAWSQETKLRAFDGAAGDRLGDAVALEGEMIAAGATGDDDRASNAGSAYVFMRQSAGWIAVSKMTAPDAAASDGFGAPVSLNAGRLLAAAWQDDDAGFASGSAYMFHGVADCNANGLLDACDIELGASNDRNGNSVPDECDPDCNRNGVPDDLDIGSGKSRDCDSNAVPDECDIAGGAARDCNANGVRDGCELAGNDCNANGILDGCEIAAGESSDCDRNGRPDECDPDSDVDGVIDGCDRCPDSPANVLVELDGCPVIAATPPGDRGGKAGKEPGGDKKDERPHQPPTASDGHPGSAGNAPDEEHDVGEKPGHAPDESGAEPFDHLGPLTPASCGAGVPFAVFLAYAGLTAARRSVHGC